MSKANVAHAHAHTVHLLEHIESYGSEIGYMLIAFSTSNNHRRVLDAHEKGYSSNPQSGACKFESTNSTPN